MEEFRSTTANHTFPFRSQFKESEDPLFNLAMFPQKAAPNNSEPIPKSTTLLFLHLWVDYMLDTFRCPSTCLMMLKDLKGAQEELNKKKRVSTGINYTKAMINKKSKHLFDNIHFLREELLFSSSFIMPWRTNSILMIPKHTNASMTTASTTIKR